MRACVHSIACESSPIVPAEPRKPLWLLPNLLSLDAPLVAIAWLYVFAQTWRLGYLPWESYLVLGLAVWAIYIADASGKAHVEQVYKTELDALRANKLNTDPNRSVRFLPYGIDVSVLDASTEKEPEQPEQPE